MLNPPNRLLNFRSDLKIKSLCVFLWVMCGWIFFSESPEVLAAQGADVPSDLYEQPMVDDPAFKSLSESDQNEILKKHFFMKKNSFLDHKLLQLKIGLGIIAGTGIVGSSSYFQYKDYWNQLFKADEEGVSIKKTLGIGSLIMVTFSFLNFLKSLLMPVYTIFANRYWDRPVHPMEGLEVEYILKKRFLSREFQTQIEERFHITRHHPAKLGMTTQMVHTILNLPLKHKKMTFDPEKIAALLSGYSTPLRRKVELFCLRQVMNQAAVVDDPIAVGFRKRVAAYFYGAPGTGKTRFAELIAEALELPFARVSLEGASVADFIGAPVNSGSASPGMIAQAMASGKRQGMNAKNMVIFMDEADRVLNASSGEAKELSTHLLKFLDPDTKSYFNPFLNGEVDTSRLIIILAGREPIQEEALRKRLFGVYFKGFSMKMKKKIIWESMLPKLCASYSQNGEMKLILEDFMAQDIELINQLIEKDPDPGFRTIEQALMWFLDYKATQKYFLPNVEQPNFLQMMQELHSGEIPVALEATEKDVFSEMSRSTPSHFS